MHVRYSGHLSTGAGSLCIADAATQIDIGFDGISGKSVRREPTYRPVSVKIFGYRDLCTRGNFRFIDDRVPDRSKGFIANIIERIFSESRKKKLRPSSGVVTE